MYICYTNQISFSSEYYRFLLINSKYIRLVKEIMFRYSCYWKLHWNPTGLNAESKVFDSLLVIPGFIPHTPVFSLLLSINCQIATAGVWNRL